MPDSITPAEAEELDRVYHKLLLAAQKMNEDLWSGRLLGLTTVEVSILSIVERKPDVILKEILAALGIPGSTLTSAVDRLEKRGLLRRVVSPRDRRSFGLELTENGRLAQREHRESEEVLWRKILSSYPTSGERRELIRLLEVLAENLDPEKKEDKNHAE